MEKEFWETRWANKTTGWDIGYVSTPLKAYIDQLEDKEIRILIPGCGNAYEAEYLIENGFKNTHIVEISKGAVESFTERCKIFPADQIFNQDFFELEGEFDLILEQTFFCAIHPSRRKDYAKKMNELIVPKGKLVGLLVDYPLETGPPFGGTTQEYKGYFEPYFNVVLMERAKNSIKPRKGRELFFQLQKLMNR